jgi:hypothetical protein
MAFVAGVIPVMHGAGQHVCHRFEAAMGVIRKTGDVVGSILGTKLVEQQERV